MLEARSAAGREVFSQAKVRVLICAFMGGYYAFFGIANHPVYLLFAIYTIGLLAASIRQIGDPKLISCFSLLIDNGFTICGLHVTGESGTFLLFFLIHISFAYGLRFGPKYLIASLTVSCLGVSWLYCASAPWQGRIHFLLSFLFGMPFISLYVYGLTEKLRRSEAFASESVFRTNQLLTFLTHDIRAPLQTLLETLDRLKGDDTSSASHASLSAMERIIEFMARMVSGVLNRQRIDGLKTESDAFDKQFISDFSINHWVVEFFETFRESVESKGATLRYRLDGEVGEQEGSASPLLERVMINVISNALRYCESGYIFVETALVQSPFTKIRITIENGIPPDKFDSPQRQARVKRHETSLYGAGLGIAAAQDAAIKAGASFLFSQKDHLNFSSILEFTNPVMLGRRRFKTLLPVVVISSNHKEWLKYVELFAGIACVYWTDSIPKYAHGTDLEHEYLEALYINVDVSSQITQENLRQLSLNGSRIVRAVDDPGISVEKILVDESFVKIRSEALKDTWIAALEIVNTLFTVTKKTRAPLNLRELKMGERKILALDDNPLNLSFLSSGLKKFYINVVTVSTIVDARKAIKVERYDALILDWNIGLSNANELLSVFSDEQITNPPHILLLSAQKLESSELRAQKGQRLRMLTKPVSNDTIHAALCQLIDNDDATLELETTYAPDDIFNFRSYLETELTERTVRVTESLLMEFVESLNGALVSRPGIFERTKNQEFESEIHRLASMCYSAGAYALGDCFKSIRSISTLEAAGDESRIFPQIVSAQRVYQMTRTHIVWFLASLRTYIKQHKLEK